MGRIVRNAAEERGQTSRAVDSEAQSLVSEQVQLLDNHIGFLSARLCELEKRLRGVLSPEEGRPDTEHSEEATQKQARSPLVHELLLRNAQLVSMHDFVDNLFTRLEL